jgi:hypothetical protein
MERLLTVSGLLHQLDTLREVLAVAVPKVPDDLAVVASGLGPAVVVGRRVEAGLDGVRQPARRSGRLPADWAREHPRPPPGQPLADVPERGGGRGDGHAGEAEQHHLRERLLVLLPVAETLSAQVRRLEHAHHLPSHRAALAVQVPELLGELVVQRREDHRLTFRRSGGGGVGGRGNAAGAGKDVIEIKLESC